MRTKLTVFTLSLAVMLVACGSGSEETGLSLDNVTQPSTSTTSSTIPASTSTSVTPSITSTTAATSEVSVLDDTITAVNPPDQPADPPSERIGTLAHYLGTGINVTYPRAVSTQLDLLWGQQNIQTIDLQTGKCMEQAGFTYVPQLYEDPRVDISEEQYIQTYGFGYMALYDNDNNDEFGEPITDNESDDFWGSVSTLDPTLTYEDAMYGQYDEQTDQYTAGCLELGYNATESIPTAVALIEDLLTELYDGYTSDPRVQDTDIIWAGCMEESGYLAVNPQSFQSELRSYYRTSVEEALLPVEEGIESGLSEDQIAELESEADDKIVALKQEELDVAGFYYTCALAGQPSWLPLWEEHTQQFVVDNLGLLEWYLKRREASLDSINLTVVTLNDEL